MKAYIVKKNVLVHDSPPHPVTKKYTWNPEESSCTPEATIGLNRGQLIAHRTASGQEIPQPEVPTELYYSTPLLNSQELLRASSPSTPPSSRQGATLPINLGNLESINLRDSSTVPRISPCL
jgi:hypothetical protein